MWGDCQNDTKILVAIVDIGDNFVVNAALGNSEGYDFWIINCTRAPPYYEGGIQM